MTGPVIKAGKSAAEVAIGKALGIAGAGVAGWFAYNSTKGRAPEWDRIVKNHHADLQLQEARYNHFHYSGEPAMDSWSSKLKHNMFYGPFGLKNLWFKAKTYTEGFVNDVLLKNLIPIGVGLGGLYATGLKPHKVLTEPFNYIRKKLPPPDWKAWGKRLNGAGKLMLDKLEWAAGKARKYPGASLALGALAAFGLYRFSRVWDHTEADEFFGQEIYGGSDNH